MKRVCHVTSAHNTNDNRIFQKECTSLAKGSEYEVFLVGPGTSRKENNVTVKGVGEKPNNRLERATSFTRKVINAAMALDADIYHLHDPELLLYVKQLKKGGSKVVFDSHEHYYQQIKSKSYIPKPIRNIVAKVYSLIENNACNYIDAAIMPCPVNGKHLFDGRTLKNIYINNYPLLPERIDKVDHSCNECIVCYTGSISYNRGINNLIDACYIAGVRLILAGPFESDSYRESIQRKNEYACVDYRGICSANEIMDIYREASIGANTLLNIGQYGTAENMSTKVYEYMMMGIPFIVNDTSFNRKFVSKHKCGVVVNSSDVDSIAEAITYLKNNQDMMKNMGELGQQAAIEIYNWYVEERKLLELYKSL